MLPDDDIVRLRHMLQAARLAQQFTTDANLATFEQDIGLQFQVIRALEIVGEAAVHVSDGTKTALPQIPWNPMMRMRNRLIHAYFSVDLGVVWQTLTEDLPPLISELRRILRDAGEG